MIYCIFAPYELSLAPVNGATTFGITTLSIKDIIVTLSIKDIIVTLSIKGKQYNDAQHQH